MALKPQLYGSNGTYAASQFIESNTAIFNTISVDDRNTNATVSSISTRKVALFPQDGDCVEVIVYSNTNFAANWGVLTTQPAFSFTETDRIEDTTHARGLQRFVVPNLANGTVFFTITWGTAKTQMGLTAILIGNTAGPDLNAHANVWNPTPTAAANGFNTGLTPNADVPNGTPMMFTASSQDTAANNQDALTNGNGWTTDGIVGAVSTLVTRIAHKLVTSNNGDSMKITPTVSEDHLGITGCHVQRYPAQMRLYANNNVQVGQLVEKAGWTRPQICSNGTFVTPKFVEG